MSSFFFYELLFRFHLVFEIVYFGFWRRFLVLQFLILQQFLVLQVLQQFLVFLQQFLVLQQFVVNVL